MMQRLAASFAQAASQQGFDIAQVFTAQQYNTMAAKLNNDRVAMLPDYNRDEGCGAILVGNSKALWKYFVDWMNAKGKERAAALEHPFDEFTKEILSKVAEDTLASHSYQLFWSGACKDGKLVPLQRVAEASGLAYLDHNTHLCLHPVFGAWFSLRLVVVIDIPYTEEAAPLLPPLLSKEEESKAQVALRHAIESSNTTEQSLCTTMHRRCDHSDWPWHVWVALRDVVILGREHRFTEPQLEYHYTKNKARLMEHVFS